MGATLLNGTPLASYPNSDYQNILTKPPASGSSANLYFHVKTKALLAFRLSLTEKPNPKMGLNFAMQLTQPG
jgi:hypothetical protein